MTTVNADTVLVSATEAQSYGVSPDRVRRWKHRNQLVVRKHRRGTPVYLLSDVIRLNEQAKTHGRSRESREP